MTKFDIFVVNLKRSADRREAMKRKIAKIRGFKAIYIDGELVCEGNSSLELHSARLRANFECSQTPSLVSHSKFAENYESQTENPSVVLNNKNGESTNQAQNCNISSLRGVANAEAIQKNQMDCHENSLRSFSRNDEMGVDCFGDESPYNDDIFLVSTQSTESTLHFHFFPATDATKFKNGELPLPPQYNSKLTRFVKGKDLSFGEIACFSSHYRLWQKCVELDSPIIVLEDDIDFMQDFCQIIEIVKSPFEYVRLHYTMDKKTTYLSDKFYISFDKVCGTLGYYLTPQAAQKFIKNARFWLFCVDDYMDMFFIHSVKNIIFKPFIISEDSLSAGSSTILGREKPKMRFYQKLTRELSRIYFFVIRKYVYFALSFLRNLGVELRAFFRANRR